MGKNLEYEHYKRYCSEYNYYKMRLANMDYRNNPVKEEVEYLKMLEDEIDELKNTIAHLRVKTSNTNLSSEEYEKRVSSFNNSNIIKRLIKVFTGI